MEKDARAILSELAELLESGCDGAAAVMVRDALSGPQGTLGEFMVSNELWGGAGSIADEALIADRDRRTALESLLIRLGKLQMDANRTNVRTAMWVTAFEQWRRARRR